MHHIHIPACHSTQIKLKEEFEQLQLLSPNILISTSSQTSGIGRRGKVWNQRESSLAFSFSLKANSILTLTSLEVGLIIVKFIRETYKLKTFLKWPNDLLNTEGEKIGGIICNLQKENIIIVGVGINYKSHLAHDYDFPSSQINIQLTHSDLSTIPKNIYQYILNNRLSSEKIKSQWNDNHFYHNKLVQIENHGKIVQGKFVKIGNLGEAIIYDEKSSQNLKAVSGTLRAISETKSND